MEGTFNCHFGFTFRLQRNEQSQFNEMKRTSFWLCFTVKARAELSDLMTFFESLISRKMKRTFSCHFWLLFQSKSRLSLLMTFFESRISMKMKRTFSCNFGFAFTAKVKLSLLVVFESIKRIATVFKAKCVYRMLLPFGRFCTELACPCQLSYILYERFVGMIMLF